MRFTKTEGDLVDIAEPHFNRLYHTNNEKLEPAPKESIIKMLNSYIKY